MNQLENALSIRDKERAALDSELTALRSQVSEARELVGREQAERTRFQMDSTTVRKIQEESKLEVQSVSQQLQEVSAKLEAANIENKTLKTRAESSRAALTISETRVLELTDTSQRHEHETQRLKATLERAQREVSASAARAGSLRTESRKAKSCIMDAVAQLRALVSAARVDALSQGVTLDAQGGASRRISPLTISSSPSSKSVRADVSSSQSQSPPGSAVKDSTQLTADAESKPETDAFGLQELASAMDATKAVMTFLQEQPKSRAEVEAQLRRVEGERNRLQKELRSVEALADERVNRLKGENKRLEDQLEEFR